MKEKPGDSFDQEEESETFPTDFPPELKYTYQHLWIDTVSGMGRCGITEFLTHQIFLVLNLELPEKGLKVSAGEVVASIWALTESVEEFTVSLFSPVSGVITHVNEKLQDRLLRSAQLELVQEDPYGEGWLFVIQLSGSADKEVEELMDAPAYQQFVQSIIS